MPLPAALAAVAVEVAEGCAEGVEAVVAAPDPVAAAWEGAVAVTRISGGAAPAAPSWAAAERARTPGVAARGITRLPSVIRREGVPRAPTRAEGETERRSVVEIGRRLAAAGHGEAIVVPKSPAEETAPGNGRTSARTPATAV